MNSFAFVVVSIREVNISFENVVDVLAGTGTLEGEGGWLPDLVVEVSQHNLLGIVGQE